MVELVCISLLTVLKMTEKLEAEMNTVSWNDIGQSLGTNLDPFTLSKARGFIHEFIKLENYLRGELNQMESEKIKFSDSDEIIHYTAGLKVWFSLLNLS